MAAAKKAPTRTRSGPKKAVKKKASKPKPFNRTTKSKSKGKTTKSPHKKLRPSKKETLITDTHVQLPHSVALSRLNPFRLPIPVEQIMIGSARFAGLAFVILGAVFTTINLQTLVSASPYTQTAGPHNNYFPHSSDICYDEGHQDFDDYCADYGTPHDTCDPNYILRDDESCDGEGATDSSSEIDPESGCEMTDSECLDEYYDPNSETVDTTPDVNFELHADEPLSSDFFVSIFVPGAEQVELKAMRRYHNMVVIGNADYVDGDEWKVIWDTTKFENGEYKLRAVVSNQYGEYDQFDTKYYDLENTETSEGTSEAESTESESSDDEEVSSTDTEPDPIIALFPSRPLTGVSTVNVTVSDAHSVEVKLINRDINETYILGQASLLTDDLWELDFDSTNYRNGNYRVKAHISNAYGTYEDYINTEIENDENVSNDEFEPVPVIEPVNNSEIENQLAPAVGINVSESSPVSGVTDIKIETEGAHFVEVYAKNRYSLIERFLGLAKKVEPGHWNYRWNTTNTPNGEFKLFAKVRNSFGTYQSGFETISVLNVYVPPEDTVHISDDVTEEVQEIINNNPIIVKPLLDESTGESTTESIDSDEGVHFEANEIDINSEEEITAFTNALLDKFENELEDELKRLRSAIRAGDEDAIRRIKNRLAELRDRIIASSVEDNAAEELTSIIDTRISSLFARLETDTERTEEIIKERVGIELTKDTDGDGITDYDEVKIYGTDPNSPDSDGDGFLDGAEILNGFDPNDARAEVFVTYESPKETGVTREDILVVENVVTDTVTDSDTDATGATAGAVISGRALPNSYVTIYIFSTPIVVTVKTADDGSWSYTFDKELEDGEHEVYVGVTDNAGKIVAKSEPFTFIKVAQAFTPEDAAAAAPISNNDGSLFETQTVILVILSMSVVGMGVVLIYLGIHLSARPKQISVTPVSQTQEIV